MPRHVLALMLLASIGACVDAEVTRIGPTRPSRADGCAVEIVSAAPPPGAVVDVASGVVSCSGDRARCLAELRKIACKVGADAIYGLSETTQTGFTHISATFATRERPSERPSERP